MGMCILGHILVMQSNKGNYYDCFDDGFTSATSWAAYEVGCILGMELEEPEEEEYED